LHAGIQSDRGREASTLRACLETFQSRGRGTTDKHRWTRMRRTPWNFQTGT
jgi:hypothetical protein